MAKQVVKNVFILAIYYIKQNYTAKDGAFYPAGSVVYKVRSSKGTASYCTTLVDGKAISCSCPAKAHCYHKTQLEAREAASRDAARSTVLTARQETTDTVLQEAEAIIEALETAPTPVDTALTAPVVKQREHVLYIGGQEADDATYERVMKGTNRANRKADSARSYAPLYNNKPFSLFK